MNEEILLEARGLSFAYDGAAPALRGVSLAVRRGERIAVLGGNGAGKSTLFLCLNGVLAPAAGEVLLHGRPVGRRQRDLLRERVGVVFQNADDQIIASTVEGEVSFGPMNLRLDEREVRRRVDAAIGYMALEAYRARPPHDLSGGEKKRVAIADILAMESEVLLFDEPAASLDPAGAAMLEAVLARLSAEGRTLLVATHDMDFALRWATRAVVFCEGQVLADGAPDAVFANAALLSRAGLRPPLLQTVFAALVARGVLPGGTACPRTAEQLDALLGAGAR